MTNVRLGASKGAAFCSLELPHFVFSSSFDILCCTYRTCNKLHILCGIFLAVCNNFPK